MNYHIMQLNGITAKQLARLSVLLGSTRNTGTKLMSEQPSNRVEGYAYEHISLVSVKGKGVFSVKLRINHYFEPSKFIKIGQTYTWCLAGTNEPTPVPRSLILAMYKCLDLFLK